MKQCILGVVVILFASSSLAGEIELEYKSFYSHVAKLDDEDTNALQFSFGLLHIDTHQLCEITEAKISTDKKQIPLLVTPENRFTVPKERALRLADSKIVLTLVEPANKCDMSVQLETKPEFLKQRYTKEELTNIIEQYQVFFEDMGGFFSFMMPSVSGINFQFQANEHITLTGTNVSFNGNNLSLNYADIDKLYRLDFSQKPLRITAVTSRN